MRIPAFMRQHSRALVSIVYAVLAAASVAGAFLLRFEYEIPRAESVHLWKGICLAVVARSLAFRLAGCDRGGWRYVSVPDVYKLFFANVAGSILWSALAVALIGPGFPRSIYGIDLLLSFLATA